GDRAADPLLHEPAGRGPVAREEGEDLAPQLLVPAARAVDEARPLARRKREGHLEEIADRLPGAGVHRRPEIPRWSQASASRCARRIVPTETASARAVSSTLRPPK